MHDPRGTKNCRLVRAVETITGKQGLEYAVGISAGTVGATSLHLQLVMIAPLARAPCSMLQPLP